MKIINLFGGPGCGKTSVALEASGILKRLGYKLEYVPEYVKDIVYDDTSDKTVNDGFSSGRLADQRHIFSEQHRRIFRLKNKVDVIITDGSLFNSIVYSGKGEKHKLFHADVYNEFISYQNINFLLKRETEYKQEGRYQDEKGAIAVDSEVLKCFSYFNIKYEYIGLLSAVDLVVKRVQQEFPVCERCGSVVNNCKVC